MKKWTTKSGYRIFLVLSGRSNVFLLTNGKINVLVDTSISRLCEKLQKRLGSLGIKTVDYLVLTHTHFDHAANAKSIKEKFGSVVIVQREEAGYLSSGDNILPRGTTFLTRPLARLFGKKLVSRFRYESCNPDVLIDEVYDLGDMGFKACLIHTPGHTRGSMSLIVDDEIALVGDTLFGVVKGSVFPPYAEDEKLMIKSWEKLLQTNCFLFIPSHGTANGRDLVERDYRRRTKNFS